jgi:hypothetical protein
MGGARHRARRSELTIEPNLRQSIIETERLLEDGKPASYLLLGDDVQLEYYKDGYPKLLSGLDRRQVVDFAQAA